jgi:hypothetical protein
MMGAHGKLLKMPSVADADAAIQACKGLDLGDHDHRKAVVKAVLPAIIEESNKIQNESGLPFEFMDPLCHIMKGCGNLRGDDIWQRS